MLVYWVPYISWVVHKGGCTYCTRMGSTARPAGNNHYTWLLRCTRWLTYIVHWHWGVLQVNENTNHLNQHFIYSFKCKYDNTGELGYDRLNGTRKIGPLYAKSVVYIWRILDMHRTGTNHIVRHMQKSVVQWSIISKLTCTILEKPGSRIVTPRLLLWL